MFFFFPPFWKKRGWGERGERSKMREKCHFPQYLKTEKHSSCQESTRLGWRFVFSQFFKTNKDSLQRAPRPSSCLPDQRASSPPLTFTCFFPHRKIKGIFRFCKQHISANNKRELLFCWLYDVRRFCKRPSFSTAERAKVSFSQHKYYWNPPETAFWEIPSKILSSSSFVLPLLLKTKCPFLCCCFFF